MDSTFLKQLLNEYDVKRTKALKELEERKNNLRESSAEYLKLEEDLHSISIDSIKSILSLAQNDKESNLKKLEEQTNLINKKKSNLLKTLNLPEDYLSPHFECSL